jgi:hypothetical protein
METKPETVPDVWGDGSWVEAGDVRVGTLVWVVPDGGGLAPADPGHGGRWATVTAVSASCTTCDGCECVDLTLDDTPAHVSADLQVWATEPF